MEIGNVDWWEELKDEVKDIKKMKKNGNSIKISRKYWCKELIM